MVSCVSSELDWWAIGGLLTNSAQRNHTFGSACFSGISRRLRGGVSLGGSLCSIN